MVNIKILIFLNKYYSYYYLENLNLQKRDEIMQYYTTQTINTLKNLNKIKNANGRRHTRPFKKRLTTTLATLENLDNAENKLFNSNEDGWMITKRRTSSSSPTKIILLKLNYINILAILLIYFF